MRITGWSEISIESTSTEVFALSPERAIVMIKVNFDRVVPPGTELALIEKRGAERNILALEKPRNDYYPVEIRIPEPRFWWPAGLGEQNLYRCTMEVRRDRVLLDSTEITFGLRRMDLVTEKDEAGESFKFLVNGVPVFMKGANWIPLDSFLPRPTDDDYRRILTAARDANMNMLRVWGGGVYEREIFYDLCDSLGIVVWQDLMYSCGMYPGDRAFLVSAGAEASCEASRLYGHPCLALFCGNNECGEGWLNWGWREAYSQAQREEISGAYDKLFGSLLPVRIKEAWKGMLHHPNSRRYIESSPRFGRADPRSLTEGDAHYWGVWHDGEPFEVLEEKVPRFMSEFGFQSLPSMRTIEMFTVPEERHLGSTAMLAHQKHPRGYQLIEEYMKRRYRVPERFDDYIYVSQLLQAEGVRIGLEAHRRAMPYCMGSLYWQLNDCWPAVSWSSIDYAGEWKALHYAARRAFAPVLVSPVVKDGLLRVHIVSDRLEELGGWLTMKLVSFTGETLWREVINARAAANGSTEVFSVPLAALLPGADRAAVVFTAEFDCPGEKVPRALKYFVLPKEMKLPGAEVVFDVSPAPGGARVTLTCDVLAKNVFLDLGGDHFSDNFFDILPGDTVVVEVETALNPSQIREKMRIRTLRDTY